MPPLPLAQLLHRALPWLSPQGRAVINTLVCHNGRADSADAVAHRLGFRNRFQLTRLLRSEGLPMYEELAGWVCVFYWMVRGDAGADALRALATPAGIDTASAYRLVKRVTGMRWSELRRLGTTAVARRFLGRCRTPARGNPPQRMERWQWFDGGDGIAAPPASIHDGVAALPLRLPLAGGPCGLTMHGSHLAYITLLNAAAVTCLDIQVGRFVGTITVGCVPSAIAVDPSGSRAYVSVQYCDEIAVVDIARQARVGTLSVPGDPFPVLVSPDGMTLYTTTNEDRLYCLSRKSGRVLASLPLPATSHHLALHPSGKRLYVATRAAGSVLEVDTARHEVVRTFALGGWPQGLAVSADGMTLFVANEHDGLNVVRLGTGTRIATVDLDGGGCELALAPDNRMVYVGLVHAGRVKAVDCESYAVLATAETGGRPRGIACDRRGTAVVVANEAGWVDLLPRGLRRL